MMMTLKILAFGFALWLIALASLPFILNSSQGQKFALEQLQKAIPGNIKIKSVVISWSGPQQLSNVTYHNPQKSVSLDCKEIEIENSLLSILIPGTWPYQMKVMGANVEIKSNKDETLKFDDLRGHLNFKANIYSRELLEVGLELKGTDGSLSFLGKDINKTLILQKPLEASIMTTSDVGKQILQHFLPFIEGVIKTDRPFKIQVLPEGFALPLKTSEWQNLKIGRAMIDLGKITIENSGPIAKVVKILAPDKTDEINLWLTPAYLSMGDGTIYLDRLDILALDKFPLAVWGKADLITDKLKMTLGITSKALKGVAENPSPLNKEMFLLPVTGTLKDAEIDTSKLTASIGKLAIQLLGKLTKSSKGDSKNGSDNAENESIPSPTTKPFPWD